MRRGRGPQKYSVGRVYPPPATRTRSSCVFCPVGGGTPKYSVESVYILPPATRRFLLSQKIAQLFLVLKELYKNAQAVLYQGGNIHIIIRYLSGVLQGCPASGWLFNSAIDPFLYVFSRILKPNGIGIVRACVDDLSFAPGGGGTT